MSIGSNNKICGLVFCLVFFFFNSLLKKFALIEFYVSIHLLLLLSRFNRV